VSGKKARKLEKAQNHARRRALENAMEKEGEVEMTDAPTTTKSKSSKATEVDGEKMGVDGVS
jgi:hypothetical protein